MFNCYLKALFTSLYSNLNILFKSGNTPQILIIIVDLGNGRLLSIFL